MNTNATLPRESQDELAASEAIHALELQRPLEEGSHSHWAASARWVHGAIVAPAWRAAVPARLTPVATRCPACHSIVYSRCHAVCGVCARPLPAQCVFSEAETVRIQSLLTLERQRHRQWLAKGWR